MHSFTIPLTSDAYTRLHSDLIALNYLDPKTNHISILGVILHISHNQVMQKLTLTVVSKPMLASSEMVERGVREWLKGQGV